MRTLSISVLIATLSLSTSLGGCAAAEESDASDGSSAAATAEDPRVGIARDAQSVVLTENGKQTGIGAPSKVKGALKSLDGSLVALDAAPRCGPPRLSLAINGAANKPLATLDVCGADPFLHVGSQWYRATFAEATVRTAFAGKVAMGDVLWPATGVILLSTEGAGEQQPVTQHRKGFDLDAQPSTREASEIPKCPPLMTLKFVKGTTDVAMVAVFCPKNENDTAAPAMVTAGGKLLGWTTYDIAKTFGGF